MITQNLPLQNKKETGAEMRATIIFTVSGVATDDVLVSYKVFGQSFFPVSCNTPRSHCKSKLDQLFFLFLKWQQNLLSWLAPYGLLVFSSWFTCVRQVKFLTPSQRRESLLMVNSSFQLFFQTKILCYCRLRK